MAFTNAVAAQSNPHTAIAYLVPPQEIVDILDAPPTPSALVGPGRDVFVLVEQKTMPPIGWLARPLERLAGYRIDPRNSGPWRAPEISALGVRRLDGVSDEASAGDGGARIDAPRGTTLGWPEFSPDGSHLSYAVLRDTGIELWVVDVASGQPRPLTVASLNATWGNPCEWLFDSTGVLCRFRRSARGTPPSPPRQPDGPNIQEHAGGRAAPVRTYQDLLANTYDEALFEYHFTSQIETVAPATGARTAIGEPGLYARVSAAPDSRHLLVERLVRPFSWLVPANRFPRSVEVWTRDGDTATVATLPLADAVPIGGVPTGPRGHREGDRPPMLLWAYPREYTNPDAASQVSGSPHRFTRLTGATHLLLLTQGYAILDGPTMPIIGEGETANDTYIEQLVASAAAAIDAVVELGVADRDRIAVGGHSYGAFMTANLLAHSDLFAAGIARSGAYNRSLTPFGFQNERRTFWEAQHIYAAMSPFFHAEKVNEPILLLHGEIDNNSGTFPMQSERFYQALKGHGATVRYVTLPHESHGYAARESVLHVVAEMLRWCDTYLGGGEAD